MTAQFGGGRFLEGKEDMRGPIYEKPRVGGPDRRRGTIAEEFILLRPGEGDNLMEKGIFS